jgi:hypothetical protein
MMSRRRLRLLIALLLPLMALRALLPAGYMVAADPGELRVVMCSDGLAAWGTHALPDQQHEDGHQPAGEDCPFANATFNAPATHLLSSVAAPVPELRFASAASAQLPLATGPPRQTGARAPPSTLL